MQPIHPIEFASFFADLERFFFDEVNDLQNRGFSSADFNKNFTWQQTADEDVAVYAIWLHVVTKEGWIFVWRLSLGFDEVRIAAEAEHLRKDELGESDEILKSGYYTTFEDLQLDLTAWETIIGDSIREVTANWEF